MTAHGEHGDRVVKGFFCQHDQSPHALSVTLSTLYSGTTKHKSSTSPQLRNQDKSFTSYADGQTCHAPAHGSPFGRVEHGQPL